MSSFLILALASSALAVPYAGHGHAHKHHRLASAGVSGTGAPFPVANATGIWGPTTGVHASTGFPVASGSALYSEVDAVTPAAGDSSSVTCTLSSTTYVTKTHQVTVTVQASASATPSATASELEKRAGGRWHRSTTVSSSTTSSTSSSSVTPVSASSSAYVAPTTSSKSSSSSSSSSATSTSVYIAPSSSAAASSSSSSVTASSTTSSSSSSQSTSSSGKRGCAYNDASLCAAFESSSEVTWGYNWGSSSSGLASSFDYVPLLWGTSSSFTSGWDAAVAASNSTHLMSFNEPDLSSQANLSPAAAAAAFKTYLQPYASTHKLGAPAVTNGAGATGLDWLDAFLKACTDCTIDFVAIHWYDSYANTAYFQEHVANASTVAGGLPVWVTEFGTTDGTDAQISGFLETVMPWMDAQANVERYSYFMASDGKLCSGTGLSTYGETFATYTS